MNESPITILHSPGLFRQEKTRTQYRIEQGPPLRYPYTTVPLYASVVLLPGACVMVKETIRICIQ